MYDPTPDGSPDQVSREITHLMESLTQFQRDDEKIEFLEQKLRANNDQPWARNGIIPMFKGTRQWIEEKISDLRLEKDLADAATTNSRRWLVFPSGLEGRISQRDNNIIDTLEAKLNSFDALEKMLGYLKAQKVYYEQENDTVYDWICMQLDRLASNSTFERTKEQSMSNGKKNLTFLDYFRGNEIRKERFFRVLLEMQAIDKDDNWIMDGAQNTIVACFEALQGLKDKQDNPIVKKGVQKSKLYNLITSKIKTPISIENFRKWQYNIDVKTEFEKKFKTTYREELP